MNKPSRNKNWQTAHEITDVAMNTLGGTITAVLRVVLTALLIFLCTGMIFACIFAYYVKTCLSTDLNITLEDYMISLSSVIYTSSMDAQGTVTPIRSLAVLDSNEDRIWVEYEDIPKNMEHAAVAIEDKRFYDHKGVDWYRTAGGGCRWAHPPFSKINLRCRSPPRAHAGKEKFISSYDLPTMPSQCRES